jgi:hypothetical protein
MGQAYYAASSLHALTDVPVNGDGRWADVARYTVKAHGKGRSELASV